MTGPAAADGHHLIEFADQDSLRARTEAAPAHKPLDGYTDFAAYCQAGGYQLVQDLAAGTKDKTELPTSHRSLCFAGLGGPISPRPEMADRVRYDGPRYLAVNGDEGEPGTFKDRHYLSTDPHRMIEGVLITAHIVGIEKAFIYMRDEYPEIIEMLRAELNKVRGAGLAGHVEIELRRGAGALSAAKNQP